MSKTQSAWETGARRRWPSYLRQKGYTLLASQWRCRFGELDLVARDKRRHHLLCGGKAAQRAASIAPAPGGCGRPQAAAAPQCRSGLLSQSATSWTLPARFDVAEVYDGGRFSRPHFGWNIWKTRL